MEIRPIFVLAGILAASWAMAQGAYRWTDANGVVHYSDVPVDGAERVDLSGFSRPTGVRLTRGRAEPDAGETEGAEPEDSGPFRYESLEIASPGAEETLWNIEGVLNVSLALRPGLQSGHQVRVYFDGEPRMVTGANFQIQDVWRGVHNIQAEVIDETGKLMIRSRPNRFYVQQNTVITRPRG